MLLNESADLLGIVSGQESESQKADVMSLNRDTNELTQAVNALADSELSFSTMVRSVLDLVLDSSFAANEAQDGEEEVVLSEFLQFSPLNSFNFATIFFKKYKTLANIQSSEQRERSWYSLDGVHSTGSEFLNFF
jgi:hypothetical protein